MGRPPASLHLLPLYLSLLFLLQVSPSVVRVCNTADSKLLEAFVKGLTNPGSIPSGQFNSSASGNCCEWTGVTCDATGGVTKLELSNMGLQGMVRNGSVGALVRLSELRLANNSLKGRLPDDLLMLSKLEVLDLSNNNFSGSLPANMSLPSLRELNISSNAFSGVIPVNLFLSTNLTKLLLQSNRFAGSLPSNVGDLVVLEELDVSSNALSGFIPDEFDSLRRLKFLSFSSNSFAGHLPPSFSSLQSIQTLNLNKNLLTGPIRVNFSGMPNLISLDLGSNSFDGRILDNLSNCHMLKSINLARNNFTGEIPPSFKNLQALQSLSLSNNSLTNITSALLTLQHCRNLTTLVVTINFNGDELPSDGVYGFQSLQVLVAANCGLRGSIPLWFSRCSRLQLLDLSWNKLHGNIPSWLGELSFLFYIDLSNNTLTGGFPVNLTGITALTRANSSRGGSPSAETPFFSKQGNRVRALQYNQVGSFPPTLDLGHNYLTGPIPPEIGMLRRLHILDLRRNNFSGSIPVELSLLASLEHLDLSENQLNGSIPESLKKLNFLSKFNVSYNKLVGLIPAGAQFSTFNASSYLGNAGLCGWPLQSCGEAASPSSAAHGKGTSRGSLAGIVVGVVIGMILILLLAYLFASKAHSARTEHAQRDLRLDPHLHLEQSAGSSVVLLFPAKEVNPISIDELCKATGNFDNANIIGCGGFGLVYRATLANGSKVAIKRLSGDYGQIEREFHAEVETLSRAQHKNLVPLQGYCRIKTDRLLIYSYMENGSLDYWLHERDEAALDWATRLKIALGAARGLAYLHQSCDPHILHRDIKSSNILLDSDFEAHLADFGLARLMLSCDTHVSTDLVGTLGYIPPEYAHSPVATMKGDVFSFGVVLLELVTGRRPMDMCGPKESRDLISWVAKMKGEGREKEVFDKSVLVKTCEGSQMARVLEVACSCLRESPKERPSIQQVVYWLEALENSTH